MDSEKSSDRRTAHLRVSARARTVPPPPKRAGPPALSRRRPHSSSNTSEPVSRVLYGLWFPTDVAAIHLRRRLPAAWCNQPGWPRRNAVRASPRATPIWSCSRWGLPCHGRYRPRGALLPHPFTLAGARPGGLLSVALSLGSPPAAVSRHRVSVEPGLSSLPEGRAAARLTGHQAIGGADHSRQEMHESGNPGH
jgi:hypothetical protein